MCTVLILFNSCIRITNIYKYIRLRHIMIQSIFPHCILHCLLCSQLTLCVCFFLSCYLSAYASGVVDFTSALNCLQDGLTWLGRTISYHNDWIGRSSSRCFWNTFKDSKTRWLKWRFCGLWISIDTLLIGVWHTSHRCWPCMLLCIVKYYVCYLFPTFIFHSLVFKSNNCMFGVNIRKAWDIFVYYFVVPFILFNFQFRPSRPLFMCFCLYS